MIILTRKRFLSTGLMILAFGAPIAQVINVMGSARQVVTKKEAIWSASFQDDETIAQRQARLAGALGLNVSELVSRQEAAPPVLEDLNTAHDGYVICGIAKGTETYTGICADPNSHSGYNSLVESMLRAGSVRMLFGYDVKYKYIDSPNYGQFFWEELNKSSDVSLSTAFLEASWRINHQQMPTVVACGATLSEAASRLDTEREFQSDPVKCSWIAWRWYTTKNLSTSAEGTTLSAPSQVSVYPAEAKSNSDAEVAAIANAIGIDLTDLNLIKAGPFGFKTIRTSALRLIVEPDGDYTLLVDKPAPAGDAAQVLPNSEDADLSLIETAKKVVEDLNLAEGKEYELSLIRYLNENSGSAGSQANTPQAPEKTIVFDQRVNGMRFIDPEAGHIEISFDARAGKIRRIRVTLRSIIPSFGKTSETLGIRSVEQAREQALQSIAGGGGEVIAGSESIGYQMLGGKATPVYRARLYDRSYPSNIARQAIIPLLNWE